MHEYKLGTLKSGKEEPNNNVALLQAERNH